MNEQNNNPNNLVNNGNGTIPNNNVTNLQNNQTAGVNNMNVNGGIPNPQTSNQNVNMGFNNQIPNQTITQQNVVPNGGNTSINTNQSNVSKADNYKAPSTFKLVLLFIFFVLLVVFIIFLPQVEEFIASYTTVDEPIAQIDSGKLTCTLNTNTTNLDKSYERVFTFTDNKLKSAKFTTITKGDATSDEQVLNDLYQNCKLKKESIQYVDGVSVTCDNTTDTVSEKEFFEYANYNIENVKSAYAEVGADISEFELDYDINKINSMMEQSGFTCKKEKQSS